MTDLKDYFQKFRSNIIGIDQAFLSPYGKQKLIYADWIASGRLYKPIEEKLINDFYPNVGNTHSESSYTGTSMTVAYHHAKEIIKKHVNAADDDVIITQGTGMTGMVNKLQRILGLRVCEQLEAYLNFPKEDKPVVFITHMEHHSNHTSWLETICDVVIIEPDERSYIDLNHLEEQLEVYKNRKLKIGSFTAASNVTGVQTDYHKMAKIMHQHGGLCFIDFAAAAPYVDINMHPDDPEEKLDAIFFSPHKFLGGPGTTGVLVFNASLYKRKIPDHPGGGTVDWTNPWGEHKYVNDIELREDGGTPGFLQTIKTALAIKLKEEMGTKNILEREHELLKIAFEEFHKMPSVHILAPEFENRLGVISFYVENIHYNLMVKLLNDRFGIQVRGGCSCAGTYGHYLLHVDPTRSKRITDQINKGDLSEKPGWVRLSLHPTMTNNELYFILNAIKEIIQNVSEWEKDYTYSPKTNEYYHVTGNDQHKVIEKWFEM
ncbi:MAG: aminotransferase class V-fold PLP-dependent enzyme [Melioribacteraceae bacterium]|nr:aminotransferase class V-fold PLP-dependent enzyme [Melioribacteraceae bacterium]